MIVVQKLYNVKLLMSYDQVIVNSMYYNAKSWEISDSLAIQAHVKDDLMCWKNGFSELKLDVILLAGPGCVVVT
jgi:hypothetical protein